jgi:glutamine amidotransferase
MVAIVDYGVGNLFSLKSSLSFIGAEATVTGDATVIRSSDKIILPGVGAFGDAIDRLRESGLDIVLKQEAQKGKHIMGICLGMQLLFDKSYEYGESCGLGLIGGAIKPISDVIPKELKIPQMGWNALAFKGEKHPIFKYINDGDYVYFVHSYQATECENSVIATTEYGANITAAVANGNVCGCQFHPEKSGEVGLNILRAFCEL